ncbi:MAG: hypothetical protein EAX87_04705 [Candidatus Thorarchaeota archaeon]|nr:hypothetical protein [Candidatus Thorarchaeota archaeon]
MESQRSKIGGQILNSIYKIFYILLGLGLFTLGVSTNYATPYFWGIEIRPGTIADYWGARVYPGYYWWRNLAILLLVSGSLVYLILMYLDFRNLSRSQKVVRNYHLYAGLFLPSVFTFGYPGGSFYNGYVGFSLTGMISPLFNYIFTGWSGAGIRTIASTPLLIPSFIVFVLGVLQVISLRQYEKNRIGLKIFLIPVLASLVFTVLMIGNTLPTIYLVSSFLSQMVTITFSVPILTIGILIRACGSKYTRTGND